MQRLKENYIFIPNIDLYVMNIKKVNIIYI